MSRKRRLDFAALHKISEREARELAETRKPTAWAQLLSQISEGEAVVLTDAEVNVDTARSALVRLKKRGLFKRFEVMRRTVNGQKRLIIINPSESK